MNFPNATPDLTKGMRTGPGTAPPQPPQLSAPPQSQGAPPKVQQPEQGGMSDKFTVQNLVQTLKNQGVPEEYYPAVVQKLAPLFNEVNQEQARHLQYEKEKAAEAKALVQQKLMEAKEDRMERHNQAMERHALSMEGLGRQRLLDAEKKGEAAVFKEDELDSAAARVWKGEDLRTIRPGLSGVKADAFRGATNERLTNILKDKGYSAIEAGEIIASNSQKRKTDTQALGKMSKDVATVRSYAEMLDKNLEDAKTLATMVLKTDSSWLNKPLNYITSKVSDNPDLAEYAAQIMLSSTDAARLITSGANLGGQQTSDKARAELEAISNGSMALNSALRVLNRLKRDGAYRENSLVNEKERYESGSIGSIEDYPNKGETRKAPTRTNERASEGTNPPGATHGGVNPSTGKMEYFDDKGNKL
jgi:hypothetical protein